MQRHKPCQGTTSVVPHSDDFEMALASEAPFFGGSPLLQQREERSLPRILRPDGVYREALRKASPLKNAL